MIDYFDKEKIIINSKNNFIDFISNQKYFNLNKQDDANLFLIHLIAKINKN